MEGERRAPTLPAGPLEWLESIRSGDESEAFVVAGVGNVEQRPDDPVLQNRSIDADRRTRRARLFIGQPEPDPPPFIEADGELSACPRPARRPCRCPATAPR